MKKAAGAYWNQNKYGKASKGYERLLKISPFDEEALVRLSNYYRQEGREKRAYQVLKSCFLSGKANRGLQLEYAECALLLDKINEGRDVLIDLVENGGESPRVNYLLWKIIMTDKEKIKPPLIIKGCLKRQR